jgi:hypothetical protein
MATTITGSGVDNIIDGTITNADINASAAIAGSKLTDIKTVNGDSLIGSGDLTVGGGKVLQVVHTQDTTQVSSSSGSFTDFAIDATITPTSSTSKILVLMNGVASSSSTSNLLRGKIYRDSTAVTAQVEMASYNAGTNNRSLDVWSISYLDSPSTTSAVRYNLRAAVLDGETFYIGRWAYDGSSSPTQITLMEIGV